MPDKTRGEQKTEWFEGHLRETLQPVMPRPEFIGSLRKDLNIRLEEYRSNPPLNEKQILLLVLVCTLSITMLVALSIRALNVILKPRRQVQ
jgi:hypothetical protein